MIKTIVTPANTDLHIALPADYVGRRSEVILYAVDEPDQPATVAAEKRRPSDYAGTLSRQDAEKMLRHIEQSRKDRERDI